LSFGKVRIFTFVTISRSVENVSFWESVQFVFKKLKNKEQRLNCARRLYNTFIAETAPSAININRKQIETIKQRIDDCANNRNGETLNGLFDEVHRSIEALMMDSFSRFQESPLYKEMLLFIKARTEKQIQFALPEEEQDSPTKSSSMN
jgi:hypothetical protein